jgi:chromosome segregation ATPase
MAQLTKKDILDTLKDFYGKIIEPRFDRIDGRLDEHDQKFQDILKHFDEIYHRFERLETEYYSIIAGLKRIEDKLDREISKRELIEREIAALRERVSKLQERIENIDSQLKSHQHSSS